MHIFTTAEFTTPYFGFAKRALFFAFVDLEKAFDSYRERYM